MERSSEVGPRGESARPEVEGHGRKWMFKVELPPEPEVEGHMPWKHRLEQAPDGGDVFTAKPVDEAGNEVEGHAIKIRGLDLTDPAELNGAIIEFESLVPDEDGAVVAHRWKGGS